jgi:hypothetical protein
MMKIRSNSSQVARIDEIADIYEAVSGSDRLDIACDLVTDLAHWCAKHNVDFSAALRRAQLHFDAEQAEHMGQTWIPH